MYKTLSVFIFQTMLGARTSVHCLKPALKYTKNLLFWEWISILFWNMGLKSFRWWNSTNPRSSTSRLLTLSPLQIFYFHKLYAMRISLLYLNELLQLLKSLAQSYKSKMLHQNFASSFYPHFLKSVTLQSSKCALVSNSNFIPILSKYSKL